MRQNSFWLWGLLTLTIGCDTFDTVKVENPVVGPPPPRFLAQAPSESGHAAVSDSPTDVQQPQAVAQQTNHEGGQIVQVSATSGSGVADTDVVARVNGRPLFAYEILEPHASQFAAAAKQTTPENLQRIRENIIRRDLKSHIEFKVLAQLLEARLTDEQRKLLDQDIDKAFEQDMVSRLLKQYELSTKHELQQKLAESNTSLTSLRDVYATQRMAQIYLSSNIEQPPVVGRPELIDYYRSNLDKYARPARVRWQEIEINFRKQGVKEKASQKLQQVLAALESGTEFADVAKQHSDGPTADKGGHWDWTNKGSLADTELENVLFSVPLNTPSKVYESGRGYHVVTVHSREEASHVPFAEVQLDIRKEMEKKAKDRAVREAIEKFISQADVEILIDGVEE